MKLLNLIFVLLMIAGAPAQAQPVKHNMLLARQSQYQGLDQAVQEIKQQTGGRILSAKTVGRAGNKKHVIKVLLPSGKVRIFKVNAR